MFKKYHALLSLLVAKSTADFVVQSSAFLGNVTPTLNDNYIRDLGWSGKIGSTVLDIFGDADRCSNAYYQTNCGLPIVPGPAGFELSPTSWVNTPNASVPVEFCPLIGNETKQSDSTVTGITNPIAINSTSGVAFQFLFRRNDPPYNPFIGTGIATITMTNGVPACTRLGEYWWDGVLEPHYGTGSGFVDSTGQMLYGLGPANTTIAGGNYKFLTRVPLQQATNLSSFQYWNGTAWQSQRINASVTAALRDVNNVPLTDLNQTDVMYNRFLKQYMLCTRDGEDYNVTCWTAAQPEGPWGPAQGFLGQPVGIGRSIFSTTIGGCNNLPNWHLAPYTYAPSFHPWYDDTHQSVVIWFTCGPNIIQAVNVTFAQPTTHAL